MLMSMAYRLFNSLNLDEEVYIRLYTEEVLHQTYTPPAPDEDPSTSDTGNEGEL